MLTEAVIGGAMASPAMRCWELAQALSDRHDVTIVAQLARPEELPDTKVRLVPRRYGAVRKLLPDTDVVVCQLMTTPLRRLLRRSRARVVLDAYIPLAIEGFDWYMGESRRVRSGHLNYVTALQNLGLVCADAVICASERQRELWFGSLVALRAIDVASHDADPSLESLVTVVPTGCPDADPVQLGGGPRELYNFAKDDVVVLWGGGVWNWFDPLTVLAAVGKLAAEGLPIRLVFMGLTHPEPRVPESEMTRQLYAAAESSGLSGTHVFLNEGWIDYRQRQSWLLDADIGISAHGTRVEAKYAFRTRVLDYLWAGLPVVATEGDVLADLVKREGLGATVAPGDVEGWVVALRRLVADRAHRRRVGKRVSEVREQFRWRVVARGLESAMFTAVARPTRSVTSRAASAWSRRCSTAAVRQGAARGIGPTSRYIWQNYFGALQARLAARRAEAPAATASRR